LDSEASYFYRQFLITNISEISHKMRKKQQLIYINRGAN